MRRNALWAGALTLVAMLVVAALLGRRAWMPDRPAGEGGKGEVRSAEFAAWARARRWLPEEIVPARVTVSFGRGVPAERRRAVAAAIGGRILRERAYRDGTASCLIAIPPAASLRSAIEACGRLAGVRVAEPVFRARLLTDDPHYPDLWNLENTGQEVYDVVGTVDADVDAPEAWAIHSPSQQVVIAIIDNGVDWSHPDLASIVWTNPGETGGGKETNGTDDDGNGYVDDWRGWDFIEDDNDPVYDPLDFESKPAHGTGVAAVAAGIADNQFAGAGLGRSCTVMHLRASFTDEIRDAIHYATDMGARVINISQGQYSFSQTEYDGINYARANGVLVCAAAGNDGTNNDSNPLYPASYDLDNIIACAASDQHDQRWPSSNYGATQVDLFAPGDNIRTSLMGRTVHFEHDFHFSTHFQDDFERADFPPKWTTGQSPPGSDNFWFISEDGAAYADFAPYLGSMHAWIESQTINTAGLSGVGLSYFYQLATRATIDYLSVQVWDGSTWQEATRHTSSYNGEFLLDETTVDISAHVNANMKIRFVWHTAAGGPVDYFAPVVDDVKVVALDPAWTTGASAGTPTWAPVHITLVDDEELDGATADGRVPYAANVHTWLESTSSFNTAGTNDLLVYYRYSCDIGSGDYLAVEVYDGANWQEIERHTAEGSGIGPWYADATAYGNANMKVRFVWHTNGSSNSPEAPEIYHVEVSSLGGTAYETAYGEAFPTYLEGTSVAAPHVAAAAALIWSQSPSLTYSQVRQTILDNVDVKAALSGLCATSGRLNAYAALASVPVSDVCVDDSNETGTEDGTATWPYNTIQEGINAVADGGTVKVATGTYNERLTVSGKAVAIQGGYLGGTYPGGGDFSEANRDTDPHTNLTVVDGGLAGTCVTFGAGSSGSRLESVTVQNGRAAAGGGVYCDGTSPTIEQCILGNNEATDSGGGIACVSGAAPTITGCRFQDNEADLYGGGIDCDGASPTVTGCLFLSNEAGSSGGGMAIRSSSSAKVYRCTFADNTAAIYGGGIYSNGSAPTVGSCLLAGNGAQHGAGMSTSDGSPTVVNCTFGSNTALGNGGGMFNIISSSPAVSNCLLWGNAAASGSQLYNNDAGSQPTLASCDVQGGLPPGAIDGGGNFNADPEFNTTGDHVGGFRLTVTSPCIARGSNTLVPGDLSEDIDGDPRIQETTVDVGADETPWTMVPPNDPGAFALDMASFVGEHINPTGPAPHGFTAESIDSNGNLDDAEYGVRLGAAGMWFEITDALPGPDVRWEARATSAVPLYYSAAQWEGVRIMGLDPATAYEFHAQARNAGGTSNQVQVAAETTNAAGDVDRSGSATALDYAFIKATDLRGDSTATSPVYPCDADGDGDVDAADLAAAWAAAMAPE